MTGANAMRFLFRLAAFSTALLFAGCNDGGLAGDEGGSADVSESVEAFSAFSAFSMLLEPAGPVINGVVAQGPCATP